MPIIKWFLKLGSSGAAVNAGRAVQDRRVSEARLELQLRTLTRAA